MCAYRVVAPWFRYSSCYLSYPLPSLPSIPPLPNPGHKAVWEGLCCIRDVTAGLTLEVYLLPYLPCRLLQGMCA